MTLPVIAVVSLAVALAATPAAIALAKHTGIVDQPGPLKLQTAPVPYLGGVGVLLGTVVGAVAGRPSVLVPLAAALVLGVADDRLDLPPSVRIAGEIAVGAAIAVTVPVRFPGAVGLLLVVAVTVLLVNGVNLLDGLDMLAGGVVFVAASAFAVMVPGAERQLAVALAAAVGGFLVFNRPPARIYLGDGGSYLLGTALAVLLAGAWSPGRAVPVGVGALALVAVPAAEVCWAVVRRRRGHLQLTAGDRGHPYDRLVDRGWPRLAASLAYMSVEGVLGVAAVLAVRHHSLPATVAVDIAAGLLLLAAAFATGSLTPDREAHP